MKRDLKYVLDRRTSRDGELMIAQIVSAATDGTYDYYVKLITSGGTVRASVLVGGELYNIGEVVSVMDLGATHRNEGARYQIMGRPPFAMRNQDAPIDEVHRHAVPEITGVTITGACVASANMEVVVTGRNLIAEAPETVPDFGILPAMVLTPERDELTLVYTPPPEASMEITFRWLYYEITISMTRCAAVPEYVYLSGRDTVAGAPGIASLDLTSGNFSRKLSGTVDADETGVRGIVVYGSVVAALVTDFNAGSPTGAARILSISTSEASSAITDSGTITEFSCTSLFIVAPGEIVYNGTDLAIVSADATFDRLYTLLPDGSSKATVADPLGSSDFYGIHWDGAQYWISGIGGIFSKVTTGGTVTAVDLSSIAGGAIVLNAASSGSYVYAVVNGQVAKVDKATATLTDNLAVAGAYYCLVVGADLYVTCTAGLVKISLASFTVTATLAWSSIYESDVMAASSDGATIYHMQAGGGDGVHVVDVATFTETATVAIPAGFTANGIAAP